MPSRRTFLTSAASAAVLASSRSGAQPRPGRPLPVPPLLDARAARGRLALNVQQGETEFFEGRPSPSLGYNGSYLGPTLRVQRGDDVDVHVTNGLRDDTTVHWHGLLVPGDLDGGPHQVIRPGATWKPRLPIRQPAGTLFYHSHVHGATGEQVYFGLTGVLIVTDAEEQALGLPSEYGVDDLPLVLQDRAFDRAGRMFYSPTHMAVMHGMRGDTLLVNGAIEPMAAVPSGLVRLRLVNGANARVFRLSFSDQRTFAWIASDSGLLAAPVERRSLTLAPGERAEIVVDFATGGPVALVTAADDNAPMMGMMGRMGPGPRAAGIAALMRFEPNGRAAARASLPARLAAPDGADAAPARRRRLVLTMGMGMMGGMGMRGMGRAPRSMGRDTGIHGIDGRAFDMERVDQAVNLGATEVWEVSGEMMWHPFHVHGVRFKVLRRNGRAAGVEDQGWRDTVLVGEPVELLIPFGQPSRGSPFMYHCHILEHEDNGMMGQFSAG